MRIPVILAFAAVTIAPISAVAAPISACQVITQSGSYELAQDVIAPAGQICFSIRAGDVIFDGQGHTITVDGAEALEVSDFSNTPFSNVEVRNFSSNGGVRIYGDDVAQVLFENLTVDGISNGGGDDVTIRTNTVGPWGISSSNNDNPAWFAYRPQILDNTITGGSIDVKILLEVVGGAVHPCPEIDAVVRGNVITNTRNDPPPEATASVRIRCATHSLFENNYVHSTGTTIGLYLRDESDDGSYQNNVFWTNTQEAIRIASGNVDKTLPARNVFQNNVFRSDAGPATFLQGIGSQNHFENNCLWSQLRGLINQNDGNVYLHNSFYVGTDGESIHLLTYEQATADSWSDNVFSHSGPNIYDTGLFSFARYDADYNLFQNRAGAVAFGNLGASLGQWQSNSAAAGNPADVHSIEADPLFVDAPAGNLCLSPSSPALGAGTDGSDIGSTTCLCDGSGASGATGGAGGSGGTGLGGTAGTGGTGGGTAGQGASAAPASGDATDEGGCGCRLDGQDRTPALGLGLGLAVLALATRRRSLRRV